MKKKKTIFEGIIESLVSLSVFSLLFVITASIIKLEPHEYWVMFAFAPAFYRIVDLIMKGYNGSDENKTSKPQ